ncbi:MAG TPA: prepilin-type N-terminal cleavage/methylation domain-containing protein [Dehalococcoidales bacterium]|nr:prepilin-type N-terminal cleavage/methylation domain-containing protein [Dehalococcoidales bacterium]
MIKKQCGYTLVEMLISLAIMGLVFVIAGTAIYQLSTASDYGNDRLKAVNDLQKAAFWFNRDGKAAQDAKAKGNKELTLTLSGNEVIVYRQIGNTLERVDENASMVLVENIGDLRFKVQKSTLNMDLTTIISGRMEDSVQGSYTVFMRSGQ